MRQFIFIFFYFALLSNILGQGKFLALDIYRPNKTKRIVAYEKDEVTIRTKNENKKYSGRITSIQDSFIVIDNETQIYLNDIKVIAFDKSAFARRLLSSFVVEIGIGLPVISIINNAVLGITPTVTPRTAKIGAAMFAGGLIIFLTPKKKHRLGKGKELKTFDLNPF
jgi:Flp pilus assembly protein TadB